jgi:hypothetical protein
MKNLIFRGAHNYEASWTLCAEFVKTLFVCFILGTSKLLHFQWKNRIIHAYHDEKSGFLCEPITIYLRDVLNELYG